MLTFEDCAAFVGADQERVCEVEGMGAVPALERVASLNPADIGTGEMPGATVRSPFSP